MKPEMLESLLFDRALGELSPDICALLDAYLAQDAAGAVRAAELSDTLALARRAVHPAPGSNPRALDLARLRRERRAVRSAALRGEMLRLAACLVLGLGLGWLARPTRPSAAERARVAAAPALPAARDTETRPHFWSVARFAPEAANFRPAKKP